MSDWWRVLGMPGPSVDSDAVIKAFDAVYLNPVHWGGDEALAERQRAAFDEGARYCLDAKAGVVRG